MDYLETVRRLARDPEQLERTYHAARGAGEAAAFAEAVNRAHAESSDDLLLAAWHHRLAYATTTAARRVIAWSWALPLAVVNGLLLWLASDDERFALKLTNPFSGDEIRTDIPLFFLLASPIAAATIVWFLSVAGERRGRRAAFVTLALAGLTAYVLLVFPQAGTRGFQEQYLGLMAMNLALLAWAGIGHFARVGRADATNRFAFLLKSLEFVVVGGLFGIIVGLFTGLTFALFGALGIEPPVWVVRLFMAGGAGLVAVIAAALTIEPGTAPREQPFDDGPSRLVTLFLRLLLPLAILVLVVFLGFVPANFREPLENREVLLAFNAMLFAVIGLLVGAIPLEAGDLGARPRAWLRRGVLVLAALALLVGVYALVAIVVRTLDDRLTPNRLTFIGWNVINIGVLAWLLVRQRSAGPATWLGAAQRSLTDAMLPYAAWAGLTLLALPWIFGIDRASWAERPEEIQRLVFEEPHPVLVRCAGRPHIYLLDAGQKRWIEDIPTFESEGFTWRDVHLAPCAAVDAVPDGLPIPPDAGSPPDA